MSFVSADVDGGSMMHSHLAAREIEIAAGWWTDRLRDSFTLAMPDDLFSTQPEYAPIRAEELARFRVALIEEIAISYSGDKYVWEPSCPSMGSMIRRLETFGHRPPAEVSRAAERSGVTRAVRYLPDGCYTDIDPGCVVAYAGRGSRKVYLGVGIGNEAVR
jgi:hypothetical protein